MPDTERAADKNPPRDSIGTVTIHTRSTHVISVTVFPRDPIMYDHGDVDYVLEVNGHPISRMNAYRARRLGLIESD
jgi:hypothetical protein